MIRNESAIRARNGHHAGELTIMTLVSALEESFDIAWSFMEKSGELRAAAEFANIILDSIERKRRWVSGEICLSGLLGSVRKLAW